VSKYNRQHGFIELITAKSGDKINPTTAETLYHHARSIAHESAHYMRLPLVTRKPFMYVTNMGSPLKYVHDE
jgi:hypothetical protein